MQFQPPSSPRPSQSDPNQQYSQPPLAPMPPRKRMRRNDKIALGIIGSLLGACALIVAIIFATAGTAQTVPLSQADQDATSTAVAVNVVATNVALQNSGSTGSTVTLPTDTPTAPAATHGIPHIGGPTSDFYGKYGQPNNQGTGNSETWIAAQSPTTILVNASPDANGVATGVSVIGGTDWSDAQTEQYCSQFLPSDASAFNSVSNLTDYHSSVGEIVRQISQGSCVLTISQP